MKGKFDNRRYLQEVALASVTTTAWRRLQLSDSYSPVFTQQLHAHGACALCHISTQPLDGGTNERLVTHVGLRLIYLPSMLLYLVVAVVGYGWDRQGRLNMDALFCLACSS
ncbi:hypothetical protein LZ32DRAFT_404863 [Colletotrichum eremochloae]|nr:hypothetical protein LZ32DRAFT_404863 [Colletotrichum eremochloae]